MATEVLVQGRTGPVVQADGSYGYGRQDRTAALVTTDAHGRYQEGTARGAIFMAANSANQALSVANATATGIILSNPFGSGKNLILLEAIAVIDVAATAMGAIALFANVNPVAAATTHTTPLIVRPTLLGSTNTTVGLADSSATLPATPVIVRPLMGVYWITANAAVVNFTVKDEIAGALAIAPGCAVSIQAVTTAVTGLFSLTWEEVPV